MENSPWLVSNQALIVGGTKWVNEVMVLEKDPIAEFTTGKQSLVR